MSQTTKVWGAPGTGKTTSIVSKTKTFVDDGYDYEDFTVITFSRSMAEELRNKLNWESMNKTRTMHSACMRLAGIQSVVSDVDKRAFCEGVHMEYQPEGVQAYIEENGIFTPLSRYSKPGNIFFDAIGYLKNNNLPFSRIGRYNEFERLSDIVPDPESFIADMDNQYTEWKEKKGLYDFDDMLTTVRDQNLTPSTSILIADEFQDFSPLQYEIFCNWAKEMEHVIMAGDPRQTLYTYRGADPKFFEEHTGNLEILSKSYRLPEPIWAFAKNILARAGLTYPQITTSGSDGFVKRITQDSYNHAISAFRTNTLHLVRTNKQAIAVANALASAGIPFKGILGWEPFELNLFNAIIKVRKASTGQDISLTKYELDAIIDAYPKEFFRYKKTWLYDFTYKNPIIPFKSIHRISKKNIMGRRGLWEKINSELILSDLLYPFDNTTGLPYLKLAHALLKINTEISSITVGVSTIHSAKGGEAQHIFLHDEITRKISKKLYNELDMSQIESEAQVFYVGATRSLQSLFIVESNTKYRYSLPIIEEGNV